MIDKLTPRFLDKSTDEKLVQKTSFVDALNVYVDGDLDSESAGVIKSIKGNTPITFAPGDRSDGPAEGNWYCLGSVTDQNTGIVYFFMVGSDSGNHGVFAYDHRGILPHKTRDDAGEITGYTPGQPGYLKTIITSNDFNFPSKGFVKGDVVYSNSSAFKEQDLPGPEKDVLLYFTDNRNEPRKVNVYRAYFSDGFTSVEAQTKRDQINACPRVPLEKISFKFENDESLNINNFAAAPGFQFAYQNIYKDGLESAISPYSDIAFPPSIVNRGATNKDNILAHNKCVLTIPGQNAEVEHVRLLARYGNGANFIEIDEIENDSPGDDITFDFLNDRVPGGVSKQTTDKTFDNLPRRAESQTVVSNRLVYGNYLEGFDSVDCRGVDLEPIYGERPPEILDYTVEVDPSIELVNQDLYSGSEARNKTIGFKLDSDQFSDTAAQGTQVSISIKFAPDNNFHIYDVSNSGDSDLTFNSYHQSRQVGERSLNLPGYNKTGITDQSPAFFQDQAYQTEEHAGGKFLQNERENYFGYNHGVSNVGDTVTSGNYWQNVLDTQITGDYTTPAAQPNRVLYGTSAGNPLILQGGSLLFKVEFTINNSISSGASQLIVAVTNGLLGGQSIDEIAGEYGFDPSLISVVDVKRAHDHEIDLGLEDYTAIPVNSGIGHLICGAALKRTFSENLSDSLRKKPPSCAFIVNKASANFYLERSADKRFRICVSSVQADEQYGVMTCVRDLDPRSPWWCISKPTMQDPSFIANFATPNGVWNTHLRPSDRVFAERLPDSPNGGLFANFSSNFALSYNTDEDGNITNSFQTKPTMEACFGYLELAGNELLGFQSDAEGTLKNFKYSLMDGEGGPGGLGGEGGAYDSVGAHNYGSIAGQVFLEYDQDAISKSAEGQFDDHHSVAYCGVGPDGNSVMSGQRSLFLIANDNIAAQLGFLEEDTLAGLIEGGYTHKSVLMGPLYTGCIVLNNLTASAQDAGTAYVNPSGTSISSNWTPITTIPTVWYSSWTQDALEGGNVETQALIQVPQSAGNYGPVGSGNTSHQVSYPYPIVLSIADGGTGGFDGEGGLISGQIVEAGTADALDNGFNSVDYERLHSHCELENVTTSYDQNTFVGGTSFKGGASHDFGIVYYDERGRHGYVNPIGSVYVESLGSRPGSNNKGPVFIKASNITHTPPSWAKTYKFAYSKNTSIDSFIQYNAGGAYVANSDYEGGNPSEIYVSLNYLQGHPISYSNSFGAKGEDGTPVMYSFTPGDRLRVLSYMTNMDGADIDRIYPNGVEFEVTGVTQFDENNNPFASEDPDTNEVEVLEGMKGLFLILKNNVDAQGFRYQDVESSTDNWGSNCIFEIYSPKKEVDEDSRLYYEVGEDYPVVNALGQGMQHLHQEVLLTQGDVFFRRHAVNLREFTLSNGFVDLLAPVDNDEEVIAPEANFKSYYLESEAATDLFPSRAISVGRPNIVKTDARESSRESSLLHSDRDVVESSKVGYSSFNRTIPSDLEIDFKAGPIHYLCNHQDSIFFVQNNKCGHIPVDRTLISDVSGSQSLIASSKFLGTPRYYAGDAGCDGDPSSVANVDTTAYFVNKSIGKVYKVHPANGVNVISDAGMAGFFREELKKAVDEGKRIIGGYDPQKKEYLLSIVDESQVTYTPAAEEVDDDFNAITVDVTSGTDINIADFFDDSDEVEEPEVEVVEDEPSVRFYWASSGGLDAGVWSSSYTTKTENTEGGQLLEDFANFTTNSFKSGKANLVMRVKNAHAFDGPQTYKLSLTGPDGDYTVNLTDTYSDNSEDAMSVTVMNFLIDNEFYSTSVIKFDETDSIQNAGVESSNTVSIDIGDPFGESVANSRRELLFTVNPDQASGTTGDVVDVVIPFVGAFVEENIGEAVSLIGSVVHYFQDRFRIEGQGGSNFFVGSGDEPKTEQEIDLAANVTHLGTAATENLYNSYTIPVSVEGLDQAIEYPLCHPDIGLNAFIPFEYLNSDRPGNNNPGYNASGGINGFDGFAAGALIAWYDAGGRDKIAEVLGPDFDSYNAIGRFITAVQAADIQSWTCPNIPPSQYTEFSSESPGLENWYDDWVNYEPPADGPFVELSFDSSPTQLGQGLPVFTADFNMCHPTYGLWNLVPDGGVVGLNLFTADAEIRSEMLRLWFQDVSFQEFIDANNPEGANFQITDFSESDEVINSFNQQIVNYITANPDADGNTGSNYTLSCPLVTYALTL
jgi:hypothetical protein